MKKIVFILALAFAFLISSSAVFAEPSILNSYTEMEIECWQPILGIPAKVAIMNLTIIPDFENDCLILRSKTTLSWPINVFVGFDWTESEYRTSMKDLCTEWMETKRWKDGKVTEVFSMEIDREGKVGKFNDGKTLALPTDQIKDLLMEILVFVQRFSSENVQDVYEYYFFQDTQKEVGTVKIFYKEYKDNKIFLNFEFSIKDALPGLGEKEKGYIKIDPERRLPKEVSIGPITLKFSKITIMPR